MTQGEKQYKGLVVVAVGGNSLIVDGNHRSLPDQYLAAFDTSRHIVKLVQEGWRVTITHGNGPQVGFVLRRSDIAQYEVPTVPMDYAGADTQGGVGYMFVRALENLFAAENSPTRAVAVITRTEVDLNDPAFCNPSKPVGSHMTEEQAKKLAADRGWMVIEDAGRGWRRVVPSPEPMRILELETIRLLTRQDLVVLSCGGGGIPVCRDGNGQFAGAEAVVDKDLASSLLARQLDADMFIVSTAVPRVALNFNKPEEKWLDQMTCSEARKYQSEGHFLSGSMGPKVEAILRFVERTGKPGVITDPANLAQATKGRAGTRIVPD